MPALSIILVTAAIPFLLAMSAVAQTDTKHKKKYDSSGPVLHYLLKVDTADLSGYDVKMQIRNAPHNFQLAMATHHEYDDRFWRFVRNFQVETPEGKADYSKEDSALWKVSISGNDVLISYRIQLPVQQRLFRFAHRPFLSVSGGLVGDIHSFMYIVGQTRVPSRLTLQLPEGWQIATGLEKTGDNKTFVAYSAKMLMDCPVLVGHLRKWNFMVKGVFHQVVYLPMANAQDFDTMLLVNNIQKIVRQTVQVFGSIPYKNYVFLLEDGSVGALEHGNSVSIGAQATLLSNHLQDIYEEIAHEFSHTWNLMRIRPAEYSDLNYGLQEQSAGLWFSEGLAMFYADLIVRRAGLHVEDSTRIAHLESLIGRYYTDTGNTVLPPAKVSLASNAPPGLLGDYSASVHLQGELLGAMLDLLIRSATDSRHSFDDVMRLIFLRFGRDNGFYARDIELAVKDVCNSREVHPFFQNYIYGGKPIDFNRYLKLLGLQLNISWRSSKNAGAQDMPDMRVFAWQPAGDTSCHLGMTSPASCWVKAGLHTGDVVISMNGRPMKRTQSFYDLLETVHTGDTVMVKIERPAGEQMIPVAITGYKVAVARITEANKRNPHEQKLYEKWNQGS